MTNTASQARLGSVTLTCLVIANMIGAGIFTTTGFSLASMPDPWWVMLAWIVGGGIAVTGSISYGALISRFRESGGEYVFLARRFHPLAGFLAGWVSMLAGFSGAIAFAALAFESYALPVDSHLPRGSLAVAAIIICAAAHGIRRSPGTISMNFLVFGKLLLLTGLITLGYVAWFNQPDSPIVREKMTPDVSTFATSVMWISLSYSGFNAAVYVAEEARVETVRRAMWLGCAAVTLLYLILNSLYLYAVPATEIAGKEDVAAITARYLGGTNWAWVVRLTIATALLTSVSSMMLAGPRVYNKMANDRLLPQWFAFGGDVPTGSILFQAVFSVVIVCAASLEALLNQLSFVLSLTSALAVLGLLIPPGTASNRNGMGRPVRLAALCYVIATFAIAGLAASRDTTALVTASVALGIGCLFYAATRRGLR